MSKHQIGAALTGIRLVTIFSFLFLLCTSARAQSGWNAVYSGSTSKVASYSFVDASALGASDICQAINMAVTNYQSQSVGLVIDARAMNPSGTTTCSGSTSNPWYNVTSSLSNTILLPAGVIQTPQTWILPSSTHLIGQGPNVTTIQQTSSNDVIQMGATSGLPCSNTNTQYKADCPEIVIEHLGIQGSGSANGITNCCAQEFSRVNDVLIQNVAVGIALTDLMAENSGPYQNITMSNVGQCMTLEPGTNGAPPDTRGVHGLTCTTNGNSTNPAIVVDTPNNTLEDIFIKDGGSSPTQDGIGLGANPNGYTGVQAQGNTVLNVRGRNLKNVVHISNNSKGTNNASNCPNSLNYACDTNVFAIASISSTHTIADDLTSAVINDAFLGMYQVGEQVVAGPSNQGIYPSIGYTRLTTSPSVPAWFVGPSAPSSTSCIVGDLYSTTSTSTSYSLWECLNGSTIWQGVK